MCVSNNQLILHLYKNYVQSGAHKKTVPARFFMGSWCNKYRHMQLYENEMVHLN